MGHRIRTHLDLLYPTTWQGVRDHLMQQKKSGDMKAHTWQFNQGDRVTGWNFADGQKWLPGRGKNYSESETGWWSDLASSCRSPPLKPSAESESILQQYAPPMSLDNDPLVASLGEQNAESTPTKNRGPRVVPVPHIPVGPLREASGRWCLRNTNRFWSSRIEFSD